MHDSTNDILLIISEKTLLKDMDKTVLKSVLVMLFIVANQTIK